MFYQIKISSGKENFANNERTFIIMFLFWIWKFHLSFVFTEIKLQDHETKSCTWKSSILFHFTSFHKKCS